jgi:hypothetical protein
MRRAPQAALEAITPALRVGPWVPLFDVAGAA